MYANWGNQQRVMASLQIVSFFSARVSAGMCHLVFLCDIYGRKQSLRAVNALLFNLHKVITFSFALSRLGSNLTPIGFSVIMTVNG